jgi:hypothetical protein
MKEIQITADFDLNDELKAGYIKSVKEIMKKKNEDPKPLSRIILKSIDDNNVSVDYYTEDEDAPKFERIARITGYLTSTTDRWNSAKQAELRDRVTHT